MRKFCIMGIAAILMVLSLTGCINDKRTSSANSAEVKSSYQITYYGKDGVVFSDTALTNEKLAESIIMDFLMKSAAWQGVDITTLEEYYLIERITSPTEENRVYYAYLLEDGSSVLQGGSDGMYSYLSQKLYDELDAIYLN